MTKVKNCTGIAVSKKSFDVAYREKEYPLVKNTDLCEGRSNPVKISTEEIAPLWRGCLKQSGEMTFFPLIRKIIPHTVYKNDSAKQISEGFIPAGNFSAKISIH